MPLRLRLSVFGAGVVALALVLFGLLLYTLLARGVASNQDDALRVRAEQAVTSLDATGAPPPTSPVAPIDLKQSTDVFVEVFDPRGALLYSTETPPLAPVLRSGFATVSGFRLYVAPFAQGYVVTGQSTRVPQSNLSGIVVFLVVSAIPALIAALLASWLVAGRALRPLKSFAGEAEAIGGARDFGRRVPVPVSRDEVAVLAASFNGMLSRLQDSFESQRRFVADASHELRTPLTTIQGNAGLLATHSVSEETRRAAATDIVAESARMSRLVDRLLTLARADAGVGLVLVPIDLKSIVVETGRQAAAAHAGRKLSVVATEAWVLGDADGLRQLLVILLDNALRYSKTEAEVRLEVEGRWARVVVADDGDGIPPDQRERVFQRFYRVDQARAGSHAGLGLAIARWIVAEHHGRILAGEAKLGGAALLVDLPLLSAS